MILEQYLIVAYPVFMTYHLSGDLLKCRHVNPAINTSLSSETPLLVNTCL